MSHTDKDLPHHIKGYQSKNRIAVHHWNCPFNTNPGYYYLRIRGVDHSHVCDIDNPRTYGARVACYYQPADHRRHRCSPFDKELLHLHYYGPERAEVRDTLRNALRDYNANGDTDIDPPTRQTRRSTWAGGWWD